MTVIELPTRSKQFDVLVVYEHIAGEHVVSAEESAITFVHHIEVNGHWFWPEIAKLSAEGFVELVLSAEDYEPSEYRDKHRMRIAALREGLTADDWLDGTTDEVLRLPVSRIRWVQLGHD